MDAHSRTYAPDGTVHWRSSGTHARWRQAAWWASDIKQIVPPHRSQTEPINIRTSGKSSSLMAQLEAADARVREAEVARPYLLDSTVMLRPYQQIGLNWLVSMHERRLNGILADEMGLENLQTIASWHILRLVGLWGPHLVVVPTSCLVNWELELKKFCPGFKVLTYYGAAKAPNNCG